MNSYSPLSTITLLSSFSASILIINSCSPVVGEYVYRGTLHNKTKGGTQKRELRFKEYEDGSISGECRLLASTYRSIKSTRDESASIQGSIQGDRIVFRYTSHQIAQSNAGAKIAAFFDRLEDGYTIQRGTFSKNRKSITGSWQSKISDDIYRGGAPQNQQGTFSFQLISGTDYKTNKKMSGSTRNRSSHTSKREVSEASESSTPPVKISVESLPSPSNPTPREVKISVE